MPARRAATFPRGGASGEVGCPLCRLRADLDRTQGGPSMRTRHAFSRLSLLLALGAGTGLFARTQRAAAAPPDAAAQKEGATAPAAAPASDEIKKLIDQLGADDYARR